MHRLLNNKNLWIAVAAVLTLAAILAAVDGTGRWLPGWMAYALVGGLGAASLFDVWHFTGREVSIGKIALVAVFLRLAVGVGLMLLLPVVGYDNEPNQAGYYYKDAFIRDRQAWQLAQSGTPLWKTFSGEYSGDQYGGMLALSAGIYRLLSQDAHRPWLILLLTSAAAGWGILCLGKAARSWFGERTAWLAAWIFALYPEGILLGGTHMREAFVIPAVAITCLSLAEMRTTKRAWLVWLGLAAGLLLFFQPPIAVIALVVLAGAWFFDPDRQRSWKRVLLVAAILTVGLLLVFSVWASLPSLRSSSPLTIFFDWLQHNYEYQTHLMERQSGVIQKLFRTAGPQWEWLIILVYGTAQPVLPAVVGDLNAAWIFRIAGFFRAVGWYALVPLLLYAPLAAIRPLAKERAAPAERAAPQVRRAQLLWLSGAVWIWVLIAAYNAGADMTDNPRYRTILLAWQALLGAWAWVQARQRGDPWLLRWLAVEAFFIASFTEWYLSRYWLHSLPRLSMVHMILLNLAAAALILGWDWIRAGMRRVLRK